MWKVLVQAFRKEYGTKKNACSSVAIFAKKGHNTDWLWDRC